MDRDGERLSARQQEVLDAIIRIFERQGFSPSMAEIRDELGLASLNGVRCHLIMLRMKGYIEWEEKRARTIRLVVGGPMTKVYVLSDVDGVVIAYLSREDALRHAKEEDLDMVETDLM